MPLMKMHRDWTVRTLSGHSIQFKSQKPTHVAPIPSLIEECQKQGAVYINDEDIPAEEVASPLPQTPEERNKRITDLLKDMIANQDAHRDHFTSYGRPNAKFVSDELGFKITAPEIEVVWLELTRPAEGVV